MAPRRNVALLTFLALVVTLLAAVTTTSAVGAQAPVGSGQGARPGSDGALSQRLTLLSQPDVQGRSVAEQAQLLGVGAEGAGSLLRRPDGRLVVEVRVDDTNPGTLRRLEALGGTVVGVDEDIRTVTLEVAPGQLQALGRAPGVVSVQEVITPMLGSEERDERTAGGTDPGPGTWATCPSGTMSEGNAQLRADLLKADFGVTGEGVKVGVLSDSYNKASAPLTNAAADIASGDLPGVGNPCGNTTPVEVQAELAGTGIDEGRAMLQIVHDLAPGAALAFATAFNGEANFAQQIRDLRTNGADVISDDVFYFTEALYQDGPIAAAIDDVTADGAIHFTSAGNSSVYDGSGRNITSYEASAGYRSAACPAAVTTLSGDTSCHDFDPGAGVDATNRITIPTGGRVRLSLGWNEPMYGITTDLDVFLLDTTTGAVVSSVYNGNVAAGTATEFLDYTNATGAAQQLDLVIGRYLGGSPATKLVFRRANLTAVEYHTTNGTDIVGPSIGGHNGSRAAVSTTAVRFDNAGLIETFSSWGPATTCWEPVDGVTPAAALSPCQSSTVDIAATNGTANTFFGSNWSGTRRFFGTSAASPHGAGVAALLADAAPCATGAELLAAIQSTADPIAGYATNVQGAGLIDAQSAGNVLPSCPALRGRVTAEGTPLGGVTVAAFAETDTFTPTLSVTTQADGTYYVTGLPPGTYRLAYAALSDPTLRVRWYDATTRAAATPFVVTEATRVVGLDVDLELVGTIEGTVTDELDLPEPGVSVLAYDLDDGYAPTGLATTAADGTYRFADLPDGTYRILFIPTTASGLRTQWSALSTTREGATLYPINSGTTIVGVDAELVPKTILRGTVTGPNGLPLAGATVSALDGDDTWAATGTAVTAADGTWVMENLPGALYKVRFNGPNGSGLQVEWWNNQTTRAAAANIAVAEGTTTSNIDAQLVVDTVISGTVTSGGSPLAGATVEAFANGAFLPVRTATTAANGTYSLTALPPNTYRVRFSAPGKTTQWWNGVATRSAGTNIVVTAGTTTPSINAALTP